MIYIIGYGAMARAIAKGLDGKKDFCVVGRNENKLKEFSKEFSCKYFLIDGFDITNKNILLAIKPYALGEVSMRIKGEANILISILAGKNLIELQRIKSKAYIRAMPNIAAKYSYSSTAITGDDIAKEFAIDIFKNIGEVIWLDSDDEIDMATAIIGSGPAFLSIIAEAISDGGVYVGLSREKSTKLTKMLFKSFSALKEDFLAIKNEVMSPKGTTAEGINSLEEDGVRGKILKAVRKTYEKSKKI